MSLKFCVPFALVAFCGFRPCLAQESLRRDSEVRLAPAQDSSVGALQPTPEMWFYEQERMRHDDPKMAIRERAELKAQQRQGRLAAQKWYGIDNARPTVSPTPMYGGYSTFWGSNTYDPLRWRAATSPLVVLRPDSTSRY